MDSMSSRQNRRSEEEIDLRGLWSHLVRNRMLILLLLAVTVAVSVVVTYLATPIYEASTTIRIDEGKPTIPSLDVLTASVRGSEVETEMEVLRSRTIAQDVVVALALQFQVVEPKRVPRRALFAHLDVPPDAVPAEYRLDRRTGGAFVLTAEPREEAEGELDADLRIEVRPGERITLGGVSFVLAPEAAEHDRIRIVVDALDEAITRLRGTLEVARPNREANIVTVRYEGPDPYLVQAVPNELATSFITRRGEVQKTEATSTVTFLRDQIDMLAGQLASAEDSLRAFRELQQVVSLEAEASAHVNQLAELQAQRNTIDAERAALARLLEEVRSADSVGSSHASPYRRLIAFPSLLRNPVASQILSALTAVENERSQLLNRRTPRDPDVEVLTDRIRELEEQLRSITTTYLQGLSNHVQSLDATLARFGGELERIPDKEIQFARLKRNTTVLEEIFTLLQTRLKEAEIAQAVEDPSVRVIDRAAFPRRPIRPKKVFNLFLGLGLGLVLGVGTSFVRERMDTAVHTREDVQDAAGITVLGMIPRMRKVVLDRKEPPQAERGARPAMPPQLILGHDPRSPIAEAYRSLRTNITFARLEQPPRTLVVTSPTPGDGKSTSAANLAITLGLQGTRTVVVDADLRRGTLDSVFDTPREPGLSDVMLGSASLEDALRAIDLGQGEPLHVLPTGLLPPNPSELLGSERMKQVIESLASTFQAVVLDSPPLTLVTDAAVLGKDADGVLVVARAGVTEKEALGYTLELLQNVHASVLGAVLNDIDPRSGRYSGGIAYTDYYSRDDEAPTAPLSKLKVKFLNLSRMPWRSD